MLTQSRSLGDKMLDIPSVSAVVAATGVVIGVVLAYLEVKSIVRARQAELFMDL